MSPRDLRHQLREAVLGKLLTDRLRFWRRHPHRSHMLRRVVLYLPLPLLLVGFLGILTASSATLGICAWALSRDQSSSSIGDSVLWAVGRMFSVGEVAQPVWMSSSTSFWLGIAIAAVRVSLPPLFFAAVLFKLLIPKTFVFRRHVSLVSAGNKKELAVRFYNRLPVPVIEVKVKVTIRLPYRESDGTSSLRNVRLGLRDPGIVADELSTERLWPMATPSVPFTVWIPIDSAVDHRRLRSADGLLLKIRTERGMPTGVALTAGPGEHDEFELLVTVDALLPIASLRLGGSHKYHLPSELLIGQFAGIAVDYGKPSKGWRGWAAFEENEKEILIFGYGSMVNAEELALYIGRDGMAPGDYEHALLPGFRRSWSVAMDNQESVPGYKFYTFKDGQRDRPAAMVVFLNIVPDADAVINGIVFRVTAPELELLKQRERNYTLVRVGDVTSLAGEKLVVGAEIFAFQGTEEARRRYEVGRTEGRLAVSADYMRQVERAFEAVGAEFHKLYCDSTDPIEAQILELERFEISEGNGDGYVSPP